MQEGASLTGQGTAPRPKLITALRRDPRHAQELILGSILPPLASHAAAWHDKVSARPAHRSDRVAASVKRRTVVIARRDGAFTGTSFYVGMPAAMMSIYCHQVLLILKLAALRGLDPRDAARAPEILVLRGRYPDLAAATAALRNLASGEKPARQPLRVVVLQAWRDLPAQLRAGFAKLRHKRPKDVAISLLHLACYVVPFLGIPVWAASYARATRQLGTKADALYGASPSAPADPTPDGWAAAPLALGRGLAIVAAVAGIATVALVTHALMVKHHHAVWFGLASASFFVTATQLRLWRILRTGE